MHDDVRHVVLLDLGCQVDVDLDAVLHVLLLDRVQERVEPLSGTKVADDPGEVDLCEAVPTVGQLLSQPSGRDRARYLGETCRLGVVEVVHAVPDRLEDPRADHQHPEARAR